MGRPTIYSRQKQLLVLDASADRISSNFLHFLRSISFLFDDSPFKINQFHHDGLQWKKKFFHTCRACRSKPQTMEILGCDSTHFTFHHLRSTGTGASSGQ